MSRPSARYVPPGFAEGADAGTRTLDPCARPLEGRIAFPGTRTDAASAHDAVTRPMHPDPLARHTGRDHERVRQGTGREAFPDARQALEYGPADRTATNHGAAQSGPPTR